MREILFRGKTIEGDFWVEGDLVQRTDSDGSKHTLIENNNFNEYRSYEVNPETVGQFTGLLDKKGNNIFQGHILNLGSSSFGFVSDGNSEPANYIVNFDECEYVLYRPDIKIKWGRLSRIKELCWDCEIIGNIHDNPELLK